MFDEIWDVLNKIAVVGTIIGIPVTIISIRTIINDGLIKYDMYRELNEAGGYTISIGGYSRKDFRIAKKRYPNREFHKKGLSQDDIDAWV